MGCRDSQYSMSARDKREDVLRYCFLPHGHTVPRGTIIVHSNRVNPMLLNEWGNTQG